MRDGSQLRIPDAAIADSNSLELVRVWIANSRQHVSLRVGVWEDQAAWGLMLADLARHIANAYQQEMGIDMSSTLQRIKEALDAELASPTDMPSGHIA